MDAGRRNRGRLAPRSHDELEWPFCGDEYPPLKGSPGVVVCTKAPHPVTEIHLNEETGWVWRSGREAWLPRRTGPRGGPRLDRQLEAGICGQAAGNRSMVTFCNSGQIPRA